MKLYFVRHGQTYLNKYKKMQGWSDSPLTPEGESVAKLTGDRLKDIPFTAVYTSDLGRTIQTAKIILEDNPYLDEKDIEPMAEFRETFFGSFEADPGNQVYAKVAERVGIPVEKVFSSLSLEEISDVMKELDPYGEAETSAVFMERLLKGLNQVTEKNYEQAEPEILVVTHGNTIRHIVKHIDSSVDVAVEIENASVTIVEFKDGQYRLEGFNT